MKTRKGIPPASQNAGQSAALCRKVAEASDGGELEIWGDGRQNRSFVYFDECIEGVRRLMGSDFTGPVGLGWASSRPLHEGLQTTYRWIAEQVKAPRSIEACLA